MVGSHPAGRAGSPRRGGAPHAAGLRPGQDRPRVAGRPPPGVRLPARALPDRLQRDCRSGASTSALSSSRWRRPLTTTSGGCSPTPGDGPPSPGSTPAERRPAPASTAPTAWPRTPCSRDWCSESARCASSTATWRWPTPPCARSSSTWPTNPAKATTRRAVAEGRTTVGQVMIDLCGIVRTRDDLDKARETLDGAAALRSPRPGSSVAELELFNLLTVAQHMVATAALREESRGVHLRVGLPREGRRQLAPAQPGAPGRRDAARPVGGVESRPVGGRQARLRRDEHDRSGESRPWCARRWRRTWPATATSPRSGPCLPICPAAPCIDAREELVVCGLPLAAGRR